MKTYLINLILKKIPFKKNNKGYIVIVKLDEIGDFILFSENLELIRREEKNKILLIGNIAWNDLTKNYFSKYLDEYIFIDKKKFSKSIYYKLSIIKSIKKINALKVIHPTQSRDFYISDYIVSLICCKNKIGFKSDLINTTINQLNKSDQYYSYLINSNHLNFEKDKLNYFFSEIYGPYNHRKLLNKNKRKNQCVIFTSASSYERRWGKFDKLIPLIYNYFDNIIICGGNDSNVNTNIFKNSKVKNFINKTTLSEFRKLISESTLLITNESFPHHLAVETNTNCIVISNGNNFGRFHPYPKKFLNSSHKTIYPKNFNYRFDNSNLPSINEINENDVLECLKTLLI